MGHPMDLGWVWMFLDTPAEQSDAAWSFWSTVTESTLSERRGETGQFATLIPEVGDPWLKVQRVGSDGGVHLDLDIADRATALGEALAAGATHHGTYHDVEVMHSPGGLPFCLTLAEGTPQFVRSDRTILDQVCLDIPPRLWDAEVAFWAEATGFEPSWGRTDSYRRLLPPAGRPMRILLQRLDSDAPGVTAHPDFASADRERDVAVHRSLGATLEQAFPGWSVLRAPSGQVYCLTDRYPSSGLPR